MIQISILTVINLPVVLNRLPSVGVCLWGFKLFFSDEIQLCKGVLTIFRLFFFKNVPKTLKNG
jgi:hypothetical protein